jgi:hypothetical protein
MAPPDPGRWPMTRACWQRVSGIVAEFLQQIIAVPEPVLLPDPQTTSTEPLTR